MKKLFVLLTLFTATTAYAGHNFVDERNENFPCRVVGVLDGDTIDCLKDNNKKVRIRLASIDAPEKSQAFGQKAKQHLSNYVYGKNVIASIENKDRYGRQIGEIFTDDSQYSVNYLMVKDGYAWAYERYTRDRAYITAQQQAKADKAGLWVDENPVNPEDYRH